MLRRLAALIGAGLLLVAVPVISVAAGAGSALAAPAGSAVMFHLDAPALKELSGIAYGIRSPGVLYVQNDSGDSARFFALDAAGGALLTTFSVPRARNVDWEDLAVARDSAGTPSVWLADIGDNDAVRTEIDLYRVDEPAVDLSARNSAARTSPPQIWRLRYPDGPSNAESVFVDPVRHRVFIATKSVFGLTEIYQVPATPTGHVQVLTKVGAVQFDLTGTPGGPDNPIGELTATGASMSADGSLLVIRTYTDAYFWPVTGGDVPGALRAPPTRIALPQQPQGEGITIHGSTVVLDSEHVGSPVWRVPIPSTVLAARTRATAPAPTSPSGSAAVSSAPHPPGAAPLATTGGSGGSGGIGTAGLAAGIAVVLVGALAAGVRIARRRRRGQ